MTRLGLRAKLTSAIVLLIVVFVGFFWLYFPGQQERMAQRALDERIQEIAAVLQAFGTMMNDMEPVALNAALKDFATKSRDQSDIAYVVFVPSKTRVLLGYGGDEINKIPEDLRAHVYDARLEAGDGAAPKIRENDSHAQAGVPVFDREGELAGVMTIGLSRSSIHEAREYSQNVALLVSAAILMVGAILSWLVSTAIATPILAVAAELDVVSNNLVSAAREQEASAAQEAAAVAETRRSMETLLDSAQQIADRSGEVLGNAERSTSGSQQIASRIGTLNELAENVAELLRIIMQVADKADLLALNASLEGTRAGEAGKGFALVASEMRRLAENVVESVAGIRALMKDMREASQAAVSASQEGTKSSTATTHSAREIALLTQEQRQATEQVMASMDEMGDILSHTLHGIQRTTASASQLTGLAGKLARMVNPSLMRRQDEREDRALETSARLPSHVSRISGASGGASGPSRLSENPRTPEPARSTEVSRSGERPRV
ncbi:MAG TPA: methyl-accepting chemotaxis protein [Haliangium sp.]|nr:methyl-accepting chemotaxis protein [Haliangium sp.]